MAKLDAQHVPDGDIKEVAAFLDQIGGEDLGRLFAHCELNTVCQIAEIAKAHWERAFYDKLIQIHAMIEEVRKGK